MQQSAQAIRRRCLFRSDGQATQLSMIFPFYEQFLQSGSYDLHLGGTLLLPLPTAAPIDLRKPRFARQTECDLTVVNEYLLPPGKRALGRSIEYVRIPTDVQARLDGKSSLGRDGLEVHKTAGIFDAGFEGFPVVELKNDGEDTWVLYYGMPIAQMSFYELEAPSDKPYSSDRNHYQGQNKTIGNRTVDTGNPFLHPPRLSEHD